MIAYFLRLHSRGEALCIHIYEKSNSRLIETTLYLFTYRVSSINSLSTPGSSLPARYWRSPPSLLTSSSTHLCRRLTRDPMPSPPLPLPSLLSAWVASTRPSPSPARLPPTSKHRASLRSPTTISRSRSLSGYSRKRYPAHWCIAHHHPQALVPTAFHCWASPRAVRSWHKCWQVVEVLSRRQVQCCRHRLRRGSMSCRRGAVAVDCVCTWMARWWHQQVRELRWEVARRWTTWRWVAVWEDAVDVCSVVWVRPVDIRAPWTTGASILASYPQSMYALSMLSSNEISLVSMTFSFSTPFPHWRLFYERTYWSLACVNRCFSSRETEIASDFASAALMSTDT